ncbi:hypothetical protein [Roseimaritima sediminicola]|uniref:hypothetical protein n=1 Tax=Roseimaritima sediminicola TaxID=2662066 RepID=UPI001298351A|nr:hypothetical protein [Roseimaritima sediminicola]
MAVGQVYFTQHCQVCGRAMRVRIELFNQPIHCAHCGARCRAAMPRAAGEPSTAADEEPEPKPENIFLSSHRPRSQAAQRGGFPRLEAAELL